MFGGVRSTRIGSEYDIPLSPAALVAMAITYMYVLCTNVILLLKPKFINPVLLNGCICVPPLEYPKKQKQFSNCLIDSTDFCTALLYIKTKYQYEYYFYTKKFKKTFF